MNYYEHHLGDYDGATAHLTWLEDCAYRRLICLYYRNESPIPADLKQACRLVRATSKQERAAVQQVLAEFFELQADGWHHSRCDAEVNRYREKSEKARANVMRRWSGRNAESIPDSNGGNTDVDTAVSNPNGVGNTPRARPQSPDTRHQTPDIPIPVPVVIAHTWWPAPETFENLGMIHGYTPEWIEQQVPSFVAYWTARGETRPSWDAQFIDHCMVRAKLRSVL